MNKTVRDILYFVFAVVLVKLIGMCTSILLARFLSPGNYGLWVTLTIIVVYSPIVCLGTVETLIKQYPYYMGRGEHALAREIEDGVFGSIILAAGALGCIGAIIQWVIPGSQIQEQLTYVRMMIGAAMAGLFSAFFYHRFAAHQNFRMISLLESSRAIVTFTLVVLLSSLFGLPGTVVGFLATELVICAFSAFVSIKSCGRVSPKFEPKLLMTLVKIGFPITIVWWIFIIQTSIDRVISMSMLGKEATGYFSLGVNILSAFVLIPQVVGRVLYPKINEEIGRGADAGRIARLVLLPTRMFSLVLPFGIGGLLLLSPFIYTVVFPKYRPGLVSAQVLLLGVYFITIIRNGINYLVSVNKQNLLLTHMLTCLATNVLLNVLFIRWFNLGINGIAISTAISQTLLATLIWLSVFRCLGFHRFRLVQEIGNIYLPFLLMVFLLAGIRQLFPEVYLQTTMHSVLPIFSYVALTAIVLISVPPFRTWVREIFSMRHQLKRGGTPKTAIVEEI